MPSPTTAIVIAVISAVASLAGAIAVEISRRRSAARIQRDTERHQRELEQLKDEIGARRDAASKAERAMELVDTYRNPLARSAYDLQSRLYNLWRGARWSRNPDYYRLNTLFLVADFLGWLEIVRREVQFLDLDGADGSRELQRRVNIVRDTLADSSRRLDMGDALYLFRGDQRAIGELMIVDNPARVGPAQQCRGYASFVEQLDEPGFARWFTRFGDAISGLAEDRPPRLVRVQHALIDLIDVLDPERLRIPDQRDKIDAPAEMT